MAFEKISNVINENEIVKNSLVSLQKLRTEAEHWRCQNQSMLWLWLEGRVPPPRCKAMLNNSGVQCIECTESSRLYCEQFHRCISVRATGGVCQELRTQPAIPFCGLHICKYSVVTKRPCHLERLAEGSCCEEHSCPCCLLLLSKTLNFVVQMKQPLACPNHKCSSSLCDNVQLYPHVFCEAHICEECGSTGNLMNLPRAKNSRFCDEHKCKEVGCSEKRDTLHSDINHSYYCKAHTCIKCKRLSKSSCVFPGSHYCEEHICQHFEDNAQCLKRQLENSFFCRSHTCRVCVAQGICPSLGPVVENEPRNVCAEHPLCSKVFRHGGLCNEVAIPPLLQYCREHMELEKKREMREKRLAQKLSLKGDGQCHGITKKKNARCKTTGMAKDGGRWWCDAHKDQKGPQLAKEKAELSDDEGEDEEALPGEKLEGPLNDTIPEMDESYSSESSDEDAIEMAKELIQAQFKPKFSLQRCSAKTEAGRMCEVREWKSLPFTEEWYCTIHTKHFIPAENALDCENLEQVTSIAEEKIAALESGVDQSIVELMEAVALQKGILNTGQD